MENVKITINDREYSVPAGITVLEAAKQNSIHIPTLCFLKGLDPHASCRMCVVEVEGSRTFVHSCAAKVKDGMVIHTDTEALRASRRLTLQLLLSNHAVDCHHCLRIGSTRCDDLDPKFCEMCFFCDCVKDGFCELQALAREYKIDQLPFEQKHNTMPEDKSSVIVRNPNKCIKCKRCVDVCGQVQTVHNLAVCGRGCEVTIGPAFGKPMAESDCIGCGRCVELCPTGAIYAAEHKDEIVYYAHKEGVKTVAQVDKALIGELERISKVEKGSVTLQQIAGSLKKIGVDYVINAEQTENAAAAAAEALLDERLGSTEPIILTNDFAAKKFLAENFPDKQEQFAFYPSALELFGKAARNELGAEKVYAFVPFGSATSECAETHAVDFAVNARELHRIMVRTGAEPNVRRVSEPETICVPEAVGKYGKLLAASEWSLYNEMEVFTVEADGKALKCATCHNLGQARRAITGEEHFDVIRILA